MMRPQSLARVVLIVAMFVVVASCGSEDGDGTIPDDSAAAAEAPEADDTADGNTTDQSAGNQQVATTASQSGTGEATSSAGPGSNAGALIDVPPPEPSEMTPSDEAPDQNWKLVRAFATVSVGGGTIDFIGVDPLVREVFEPTGDPIEEDLVYVAGCSILQVRDGGIIAQASFHHMTERNLHSSFSMSDNGDGTVVWGLYNAESGEEWSATGPGSATIRYLRFSEPEHSYWDFLGYDAGTEELYVLIDFEGPASENLSTDKSQASSRVLCHYLPR